MFAIFRSAKADQRAKSAAEIRTTLAGRWDLSRTFSLPGQGPANLLVEAINQMSGRLQSFVLDLTRRNVATATVAPLTHAIAGKVRESSAALSHGAEQIEATSSRLAEAIGASADGANRALVQSAEIVAEIDRTTVLTEQALERTQVMARDVDHLSSAIADLDNRSRSIGQIIETISDIADHTGLLSLNASIEAARAGAHGAGFGVIAQEIRTLSQESAKAAEEVNRSLRAISELIRETVDGLSRVQQGVGSGVEGNRESSAALAQVSREHRRFHGQLELVIGAVSDQQKAMAHFAGDITRIAAIGREGQSDSAKLAELAERVKTLTEEQLLATGIFILPQYRKAEGAVATMAEDPDVRRPGPRTDQALHRLMLPLEYLELVYLTDAAGIQLSSNILRSGQTTVCDDSVKGRDWSRREWFRRVREKDESFISEIYRSQATDSFCLTIAVPVRRDGVLVGVLGADINFEDLLAI